MPLPYIEFVTGVCYRQGMLKWLLALAVALVPAVLPVHAQEEGGGDGQQASDNQGGGDEGGGQEQGSGGNQGGGDQSSGGDQNDGEQKSGGEQGDSASADSAPGDGEASVNIVGDIAADDGEDEVAARKAAPAPTPRKAKVSKAKGGKAAAKAAAKARLSRRRRGAAVASAGGPAVTAAPEAEPQFPELDLPDMKAAVAKKEPPPPTAPLVPMPLYFP